MKTLWMRIARFFWRLAANPIEKAPVGLPYMRDPDNRCHVYEPKKKHERDFGDCQGDGHYLCDGCAHLSAERRKQK